ncbi:MAG: HD domain-containing phosphohydrolase [Pirellulaceae bacterium]
MMNCPAKPRILLVDDDPAICQLLTAVLHTDYTLAESATGQAALAMQSRFAPDIVLLDAVLPGLDGYETCRRLKQVTGGPVPQVIIVSGRSSSQEQLRAYEAGADDYITKPLDPHDLLARIGLHIQLRAAQAHVAEIYREIDSRDFELKRLAEQRTQDVIAVQHVAVFTLARVAESRDQETAGHLTRMRAYSQVLAEHLAVDSPYAQQINHRFLDDLYRSSPLHDIGKVAIPDDILLQPRSLTSDEFAIMQQHTTIGANILDQAVMESHSGGFLAMAALVARFHHERYDGTGYPVGLAGVAIPLPARIVALADAYDAITSERPYKPAFSPSRARELIQRDSGRHFDPVVVEAFQTCFPAFLEMQQHAGDDSFTVQGAVSFREFDQQALDTTGTAEYIGT